ncbi:MAG: tyrosine-type recombinase/integrase [Cyanobacteria bacterium SZAS TMP-1]|nr:tyrosine-type recombinase/integrase [Cyanobacteria bacterium SZAS TMP-1]
MTYLAQSERSPRTLENVFCDLQSFADWLKSHGIRKRLDNSVNSLVVKYARTLEGHGYKPSTIARHLHSIRGWFIFCKLEAVFILELAAEYKPTSKTEPKSLTENQVAKLLASNKRHAKKEDRLLIEFLLHTGLTAGEVCGLTWRDLSTRHIPGSRRSCVMLEVGGRSGFRDIPASEKAVSTLVELGMEEILAKGGKGLDTPIFNPGGLYMTPKMVHYAVTQCGTNAAVNVTPSTLRNTFAYRLVSSGVSKQHLAEYMGISEQSASAYYPTKEVLLKDLFEMSRKT